MNQKLKNRIVYLVLLALVLTSFIFAGMAEVTEDNPIWNALGIWTLLPPFIAIVLAFVTKNVIISLTMGIFTGTMLVAITEKGWNFAAAALTAFSNFMATVISSMADKWNAGIMLQCLAIGGLIAVISRMGGTHALAEALSKKAKSPRSSQFVTWFLGLFVFFDDYANSLIVGPIMKPVTDKQRISREKLSFIVDATAAPITGIALVSTWIGYELSLIKAELAELSFETSAYNIFLETIPYRFYNIFILAFIVITILMLREFGPMLKAENRARKTGKVLADGAKPLMADDNMNIKPEDIHNSSMWNAIIPVTFLVFSSLIGFYINGYNTLEGETLATVKSSPLSFSSIQACYSQSDASIVLFTTAILSGILALIMGSAQKIFTIKEGIDTWVEGWKSMIITVVILLLAWSIADIIKNQLDADRYLANALNGQLPAFLIPSIVFILGSLISFATGTSYGTMGILMPLTIPLANTISSGDKTLILASIAAVLTGAILGDHCSPISDTTILSSMGTSCDHIDHVKTQLPYAILIGAVSLVFGFIPAGFKISPYISLPVGLGFLIVFMLIFGKKVKSYK